MKKVIGIVSIVLCFVVGFQSCLAGTANTLSENGESGGTAGLILAVFLLIAGILTLVSKNSKGITVTAIVLYVLGGLLGLLLAGSYGDLVIWSVIALVFAVLLIVTIVRGNSKKVKEKPDVNS